MFEKLLYCSTSVKDCDSNTFEVSYYVTNNPAHLDNTQCSYGISIEKDEDEYTAPCCFKTRENAIELVKQLSEYSITPIGAEDAMDEILKKCDFKYPADSTQSHC